MYNFQIPNRVIQELYYQYFVDITEREYGLNDTATKVQNALKEFSKNNNPHPFLDIIKTIIDKDLSFRDAQGFDEKHLKMLMIPYLSLSASHYVKSEEEWENGYVDVLMLKRPTVTTKYNFLIELKYIKKADESTKDKETKASYVEKVEKQACAQVQKYLQSDNAKRIPNLKAWLFILVGREWHLVEEIGMP